jgi:hypothetical protein
VGGASALLERPRRAALFVALLGGLVLYYLGVGRLPDLSVRGDVLLTALVLIPAVFALVLLALPLRRWRGVAAIGLAFAVLAVACEAADLDVLGNFAKLAAAIAIAFWFLDLFERLSWVVLVAAVIPLVDAISVWRGPTRHIVSERPEVFGLLSFAFPVPDGAFLLGLPDLLFFGVFLAAAARWALRLKCTWLAMTASFGVTMATAVWLDPFDIGGLPALPLLSIGFLAANADLLWRELRGPAPTSTAPAPLADGRLEQVKETILAEAVHEDWWRLWEPLDTVHQLYPELSEAEQQALVERALRELHGEGLVDFLIGPEDARDVESLRALTAQEVDAALRGVGWRQTPAAKDVLGIWIGASEAGERACAAETSPDGVEVR